MVQAGVAIIHNCAKVVPNCIKYICDAAKDFIHSRQYDSNEITAVTSMMAYSYLLPKTELTTFIVAQPQSEIIIDWLQQAMDSKANRQYNGFHVYEIVDCLR